MGFLEIQSPANVKPFNPEQVKTFRAPKYGGVTLSLLSMFVLGSMMVVWNKLPSDNSSMSLRVLCDEALRKPVEEGVSQFEKEMQISVSLEFVQSQGKQDGYDLYIPVERNMAKEDDAKTPAVPIAFQSLVLATRKNYPDKLRNLDQVFEKNLSFAICRDSSSCGVALEEALALDGRWEQVSSRGKTTFPSSLEAAVSLASAKELDAIFIWDSIARQFDLQIHHIKELENISGSIKAIPGKDQTKLTQSLQLARFMAAPEKGQFYFAKHRFIGVNGDAWSENPTLYVYCANQSKGLMLEIFEKFEERERVCIDPHFLDQEKIPFTIGLIAQSKAKRSLPDLVFGSMGDELSGKSGIYSEPFIHRGNQVPVYKCNLSRFPHATRSFIEFLQATEEDKN